MTSSNIKIKIAPNTDLAQLAKKTLADNLNMVAHNNGINMADLIFRAIRADFAYKIPTNYLSIGMRIIKQDYGHAYNAMNIEQKITFEKAFRAELKGAIEATIKRDKLEGNI